MVSESEVGNVMSVCLDFTQNAWKKDLCVNCQRPKTEHATADKLLEAGAKSLQTSGTDLGSDSPKPAKRNSLMIKSWTPIASDHDIQKTEGCDDNEEDKWNSMCLPDPNTGSQQLDVTDTKFAKASNTIVEKLSSEHSKSDAGDDMKSGHSLDGAGVDFKANYDCHGAGSAEKSVIYEPNAKTVVKKTQNPEDRLITAIHPGNEVLSSKGRTRSLSREQSPMLAPKPKLSDKPAVVNRSVANEPSQNSDSVKHKVKKNVKDEQVKDSEKYSVKDKESDGSKDNEKKEVYTDLSPRHHKKLGNNKKSISFVDDDPVIIGDDGGLDNLYSDHEDDVKETETGTKELLHFTEDEKDWALQALKNTVWNIEHVSVCKDSEKKNAHCKEFEDLKVDILLKSDRLTNAMESDPSHGQHSFGTFPLRSKSEKTVMDNIFSGNRLSTLTESSENLDETSENKYDAVMRFLGADKFDFASSPKHKNAMKSCLNVSDGSVESDPSYDDPWCDKFAFESESEMNLLDEIKGEIDLDSSTAGFALDVLNDVLAKYSVGSPSETDSFKNVENLNDDIVAKETQSGETNEISKVKSAQFEAKMVTIAANLRKQQAKGRAPRPPSCPPEPPLEYVAVSPAKQLDLRAAQSREPTFSMVPVGKPIGANLLMQAVEAQTKMDLAGANAKHDLESTSSCSSLENVNLNKVKLERDKQKKTGGFGSFFSRLFNRGSQSETDMTVSSETLSCNSGSHSEVQCDTANQSEKESNLEKVVSTKGDNSKDIKRPTKSSPPMKLKVLPTHPVSARPTEKPPLPVVKKENEIEVIKIKENSPKPEVRCKGNISNEIDSSQKIADTNEVQAKSQISPAKSKESLISSPKLTEAPPLPIHPPRDSAMSEQALGPPKPHDQGNMDSGTLRSRPRKKDSDTLVKPGVPPPKPPVAIKPRPPVSPVTQALDNTDNAKIVNIVPRDKEVLTCTHSLNEVDAQKQAETKVLKKRAKSPKRVVAPLAPSRVSMPNILTDSNISLASNVSEDSIQSMPGIQTTDIFSKTEVKGSAFAKELEMKFSKDKDHPQTVAMEARKLGAPPNPPSSNAKIEITEKEKSKSLPAESKKPLTLIKDKEVSKTFPRESDKEKSFATDDTKFQTSDEDKKQPTDDEIVTQSKAQLEEVQIHLEKIELPKPAGNSRKSFLGKLNRKSKQAPTPSVKRTKSITESSIIADHHLKKIDVKDISGPVLITEMSCNKVVNRRNTISLGDDTGNSFLSGGSTSSGSTSAGDKSDLSPRGSIENMYEFIKTEAPMPPVGDKKHLYDPIIENNGVSVRPPSYTGSEGYLEPVRSNSGALQNEPLTSKMADSKSSMTSSMVAMVNNIAEMDNGDFYIINANISQQDLDEMEISPERQALLASQPIYEEIQNGNGKPGGKFGSTFSPNVLNEGNVDEQIYGVNSYLHCESAATQNAKTLSANQIAACSLKSKDSFSSDSELSSASNSLSHPRPIPRRRARQIGSGFEQYVAMNRPSVAVFLNEEQLREMLGKLTAMNLSTLRTIYTQHEKCFTKESLHLSSVGPLKWQDFDIYGKPVHTSEKCIVYNAKMRLTMSPCQLMLLHSRPVITSDNHPSLLKPTCIFTDSVPYSYLTDEFIKTSQILETCVNQSNANVAECYIVVGLFDITESLTKHMNSLETVCENQDDFLRKVLFIVLQLLSAISHCLEQGHPLSEADFHDLYLISNPHCLGETVSFLPQVRAPEDQQLDKVCLFLEKFLDDMCKKCEASSVLDDLAFFTYTGVQRVIELLESGVMECLPVVRSYTEFLLWGPADKEKDFQNDQQINLEPKLSMWLEKERAELIHDFAKGVHRCADCNIRDFYKMKFLLKSSSGSLLECLRCHSAAQS